MKCQHLLIEREEAATVDGRCPLCPPFDIDKVAEEIANELPHDGLDATAIIRAILYRAINGEGK